MRKRLAKIKKSYVELSEKPDLRVSTNLTPSCLEFITLFKTVRKMLLKSACE